MNTFNELFIGGRRVAPASDARIEVHSPYDGTLTGSVPMAVQEDIDRAVTAARSAFDTGPWGRSHPEERQAVMKRFLELYEGRSAELAALVVRENGSPIAFSGLMPFAVKFQGGAYLEAAAKYPWEERVGTGPGLTSVVRREPVGVVAAIIPWNAPQQSAMVKLFPALLAGCTVILKLAPETAIDGQYLGEILAEAGLPEGVLSIIAADRDVSEYLVTHPGIDKIAFTGSTAAGRRIASLAGERLKRFSLELGGKSASIVLPDADLPAMIDGTRDASFRNVGQACITHSRLLVPRNRQAEIVSGISSMLDGLKIGDPMEPDTHFGPVASERQRERVESYIRSGIDEGATLAYGGLGMPDGINHGAFVRPTIFSDVDNRMKIAREEIFGPVLSVIPYDDAEQAIAIANDSDFGLSGGVWTQDAESGLEIARRIRTGTLTINGAFGAPSAPFGGYKQSGIGRECGAEGLGEYCEIKAIAI